MKQLFSNGRELEVRDVGEPVVILEHKVGLPLPLYHHAIMEDVEAREICKDLINKGYRRVK